MFGYKGKRSFLLAYGIIALIAVTGFFVRLARFSELPFDIHLKMLGLSLVVISLLWEALRNLNKVLDRTHPFEKNLQLRIILQVLGGAAFGLLARILIFLLAEPHFPIHLDTLFLATTWVLFVLIPTAINLLFFINYFIGRWKDSIVYAERIEKEKALVQFDNLKNQMNPHFLFNALTSLNTLIFEDQRLASEFLQQLSKVYRYLLQHKDNNSVLLKTELDFIANYVRLLETRFGSALRINFSIRDDTRDRSIVPVTLQILIENAVKHNVIDPARPLEIDILTVGEYLIVSNNLQEKSAVSDSNKQGLENLRSLYRFLTDKPVIAEVTEERFFVKIPLI